MLVIASASVQLQRQSLMAFVFGKSQKESVFDAKGGSPGPAQYLLTNKEAAQLPAPFNSSTYKVSAFDVLPTNTGPGSYNPHHQKDIQSINNKMHMTSSFCSKVDRFRSQPSAGSHCSQMKVSLIKKQSSNASEVASDYSSKDAQMQAVNKAKSRMNQLQTANSKRKIDSIGTNKDFVRIILSNPKNTQNMHSVFIDSSIEKKSYGPGSYNLESSTALCKKRSNTNVTDWSKATVSRFQRGSNKGPGPGTYQTQNKDSKRASSLSASFAYQGLRSCMDEQIYKTKMPFKVKVIEQKGLKDRYPGPGHYDPLKAQSKSFHNGYDGFGSGSFEQIEQFQGVPGPGSYLKEGRRQSKKSQLKKVREKIFGKTKMKTEKSINLCDQNKAEVRKQCLLEMQKSKNKFYSLKERCTSNVGNFQHAQRWDKGKNINPGPGQYLMPRSHSEVEHKVLTAFNSSCSKDGHRHQGRQTVQLPFYEVERNDLGQVALRVKRNIQNLKQIDIEKAPFNTKQQRFDPSVTGGGAKRGEYNELVPQMVCWNAHQQQEKAKHKIMKNTGIQEAQPSASFKSSTKRAWVAPSHYLGPGKYDCPSSLQKKSFNREYNYQSPVKIRGTFRTRSSLC